jgi:hypothetical protein
MTPAPASSGNGAAMGQWGRLLGLVAYAYRRRKSAQRQGASHWPSPALQTAKGEYLTYCPEGR